MKSLPYSDFSSRLHSASLKKRIPLNATLELTHRCDNCCVHCYCNLPASDERALRGELSTAEIKKLLDELASMGSLWLLITGGEPLLREDFEEIYRHAKGKGFLITLFTNGILVHEGTVRLLSMYPPFAAEVTLYGATEATYEKVTRIRGSYSRCMEGIEKILGAGVKVRLKTMALTINRHEIRAMDGMARELGCEFRFDAVINKRIDDRMYSEPEKYRIPPGEAVQLDRAFPKRMDAFRDFCAKFLRGPSRTERLYQCGAGVNSIHINPYGAVKGCVMMVRDSFSVKDYGLRWIWDEGIPSVINQKKDFPLPCDDCRLMSLCGQCPPWSILENGDIKKEVAYLCKMAKIREKEFEFISQREGG